MMNTLKAIILSASLIAASASAQTLNDEIVAYLGQNKIAWDAPDWATNQQGDNPMQISVWNSAKLGQQPTGAQLSAMNGVIANQRQALQFNAVLAAGIQVTCATGATICTAAIQGTYAVDDNAQLKISAAQVSIDGGHGLPGSGTSFLFKDLSGSGHPFTASQFTAFSVAARDFYYAASVAEAQLQAGVSASWPVAVVQLP